MVYTFPDGPVLQQTGVKMMKKPDPVWMNLQDAEFSVMTNEGLLTGHPGDYVAYDPISGHIWLVAASYVAQHYEKEGA